MADWKCGNKQDSRLYHSATYRRLVQASIRLSVLCRHQHVHSKQAMEVNNAQGSVLCIAQLLSTSYIIIFMSPFGRSCTIGTSEHKEAALLVADIRKLKSLLSLHSPPVQMPRFTSNRAFIKPNPLYSSQLPLPMPLPQLPSPLPATTQKLRRIETAAV